MAEIRFAYARVHLRSAGPADVPAGRPVVGGLRWRLLGRNHRELGRSPHAYADEAACRGAVVALRCRIDDARPVVTVDGTGRWLWRLDVNGVPVAVCARAYARHRECLANLRQFRAAVPVAGAAGIHRDAAEPAGRTA